MYCSFFQIVHPSFTDDPHSLERLPYNASGSNTRSFSTRFGCDSQVSGIFRGPTEETRTVAHLQLISEINKDAPHSLRAPGTLAPGSQRELYDKSKDCRNVRPHEPIENDVAIPLFVITK